MRDTKAALAWFKAQSLRGSKPAPTPSGSWFNYCLMGVRLGAGIGQKYGEADIAWAHTKARGKPVAKPDPGWFVWWDRPGDPAHDHDAGHVAFSAGEGLCWSTDVKRRGHFDLVRISSITEAWGLKYVGVSRDLNGVLFLPVDRVAEGHYVTVRQGDTVSGLVGSKVPWAEVWHDDRNDALRARRKRPEAIRPGDKLWIP